MGVDGAATWTPGRHREVSSEVVVLHYPFMHFDTWRVRWNIVVDEGTWHMGFYNDSRKARHLPDGGRDFYQRQVLVDRGRLETGTRLESVDAEATAEGTHARMRTPRCCDADRSGAPGRACDHLLGWDAG